MSRFSLLNYRFFRIISKFIFWLALLFLAIALWTFTIGQTIGYEFKDLKLASDFYYLIFTYSPIAILFTLFETLKKKHSNVRKFFTVVSTAGFSVCCFLILLNNIFTIGFGVWTTTNIAYEQKQNPQHQVREQLFDLGALGYGGRRVAELKPFGIFFWKVNAIDTTGIDKTYWIRIDKEGDAKFP